jgi:hypothetical protein
MFFSDDSMVLQLRLQPTCLLVGDENNNNDYLFFSFHFVSFLPSLPCPHADRDRNVEIVFIFLQQACTQSPHP